MPLCPVVCSDGRFSHSWAFTVLSHLLSVIPFIENQVASIEIFLFMDALIKSLSDYLKS